MYCNVWKLYKEVDDSYDKNVEQCVREKKVKRRNDYATKLVRVYATKANNGSDILFATINKEMQKKGETCLQWFLWITKTGSQERY